MANVKLNNISKVFDKSVEAVKEFNLEIADKEFIVLVGPSGCGKSTTLRMVAGLEEVTKGEIYIGENLVNSVAPKDRDIAMVFQNYALYPHMSVYGNMAFSLQLRKIKKSVIEQKVREAADLLGITELLKRRPKALSGGQRQRVAIGRAIVREPKVFLMDEPLSNLDAKLRNQMRAEIIKMRKRVNTTFIYVTHDQTEAMTLGDRIVVMKDGLIQQIGTPQEVFNRPANLFVAGFIGTPQMNFFPAQLEIKSGRYVVKMYGAEYPVTDEQQKILEKKGIKHCSVVLGLRPEHVTLVPGNTKNSIKAEVDVSELMGSEIHLHAATEGVGMIARVPTTELNDNIWRPGKDKFVNFTVLNEVMHLFDAETEQSLFI
jgi:multiple sugar transport system ATP-binding protein